MTSSINFIQYVIILLEKTLILVWMSVAGRDVHPRVAKLWTILAQYCLRTRPKLGPILDTPWAMPWVTTTLAQARTACANNIGPSLVLPGYYLHDRHPKRYTRHVLEHRFFSVHMTQKCFCLSIAAVIRSLASTLVATSCIT